MNDLNPDEKGKSCCAVENAASSCCQPTAGNVSSCCSPRDGSWSKGKVIISVIIIVAAIGVGANSFVRGTSTQADKTGPTESFFVGLTGRPAAESEKGDKADQVPKRDQVSVLGVLDSLQALNTLASDKDVVFVVLQGDAQNTTQAGLEQVGLVVNHLGASGQKVGAFTLNANVPDYGYLVRHFGVTSFPCVVVLGRRGAALAVSGDISGARLYGAFLMASRPGSCCPTQGDASCCPK